MATIQDIVNSVTSNPSTASGIATPGNIGAAQTAYQNALTAEPNAISSLNTSLQGQVGLPAQQSQYSNLGTIYQLWLNDPARTEGQYASNSLSTPNSQLFNSSTPTTQAIPGGPTFQNPYLQSASQIMNAAAPNIMSSLANPSAGFTGFSSPGLINSAVAQVPNSASSIQAGLQNTMNSEQTLINQDVNTYNQNYQNTTNLMSQLVSVLTNAESNYNTSGLDNTMPGSKQEGAAAYEQLVNSLGPDPTADQIYAAINEQRGVLETLYGPQVVDYMYAQQKQTKDQFPTGSVMSGNQSTATGNWTQKTAGDGTVYLKNSKTGASKTLDGKPFDPNAHTGTFNVLKSLSSFLGNPYGSATLNNPTGSSSGGTTVMTGPGGTFNVPNNKVSLFKQNGYK